MAGETAVGLRMAVDWLAANWPLLGFIPLAQMAHELAHFAVARYYDTEPVIVIRLRTPMRVVYDDRGLTPRQRSAIGLAPTLTGLVALLGVLWWLGGVSFTPATLLGAAAWALYTLPSRADTAPLGDWLGPDEPLTEGQRSVLIGVSAFAIAAWLPALPVGGVTSFMVLMSQAMAFAAVVYLVMAIREHGLDEGDGSAI